MIWREMTPSTRIAGIFTCGSPVASRAGGATIRSVFKATCMEGVRAEPKCDAISKTQCRLRVRRGSRELLQECRGDALTDDRPQCTVRLSSSMENSPNSPQTDTPTVR